MDISKSYVCKQVRVNLFEAFDTKEKKKAISLLLPSCMCTTKLFAPLALDVL